MAWADGVVEADERNRIKVLFNGFDLDEADRREIDAMLERPVPFDRAVELTKEFAGRLSPPGARRELLAEIESMLGEESERAAGERELLDHVRAILSSHTVVDGLVEKLRGLFSTTLFDRSSSGGDRAGDLVHRARNAALARVEDRFRERGWSLEGREGDWNRATLIGILLGRVGRADGKIGAEERRIVDRTLAERYGLDEPSREVTLAVLEEEAGRDLDLQRVCAEACHVTSMAQRLEILEILFEIGAADGRIGKDEVEEIHRIADLLWISRPEYLAVRDRWRDRIES
jgi:uncharacterized tellurite resistance protein B-like protein